jgi:hypothetical protein
LASTTPASSIADATDKSSRPDKAMTSQAIRSH